MASWREFPVLALVLAAAGCGGDPPATCGYSGNGHCDEPTNCHLGTDTADCAAVCARDPEIAPIACSYRGFAPPPQAPGYAAPEAGSHGTGGPRGTWDGSIRAKAPRSTGLIDRYYRVRVPLRYDPGHPTPLLYVLGGFTVSMYDLASYTEIERTADQNDFIVVYLEAPWQNFSGGIGWVFAWWVYLAEWTGGTWQDSPDVDFVRRLTLHLESLYNLDRTRIFASGHSRGAAQSIILAYTLPGMIAGYAEECGFVHANAFDEFMAAYTGPRRVPGVIIHGLDDPDVEFAEAETLETTLQAHGDVAGTDYLFLALPNVTHRWQPALNQTFWDFLHAHPLPLEMVQR